MKYNFFQNKKALFLLMAGVFLSVEQTQAAPCNDVVAGRIYTCNFVTKEEEDVNSDSFTTTLEFNGTGKLASFASNLFLFGCSCEFKGKLKKPKFEIGKEFQCIGTVGEVSVSLVGKASKKGNKIKKGVLAAFTGATGPFECLEGLVAPSLEPVSDSAGFLEGSW